MTFGVVSTHTYLYTFPSFLNLKSYRLLRSLNPKKTVKSVHLHETNPAVFVWAGVSDVRTEVSRRGPRHPEGRRRRLRGAGKQHLLWAEAQARVQTAGPAGSRQRTCGWHLFNVTRCMLAYVSSQPPQRSMSSLSLCLSGTWALLTDSLSSLPLSCQTGTTLTFWISRGETDICLSLVLGLV